MENDCRPRRFANKEIRLRLWKRDTFMAALACLTMSCADTEGEGRIVANGVDCRLFPADYTKASINIADLQETSPAGLEAAMATIQRCYMVKPYRSDKYVLEYQNTVRSGDRNKRYIVYRLLGLSHVRILFLAANSGKIEGSFRTTQPFQEPAGA